MKNKIITVVIFAVVIGAIGWGIFYVGGCQRRSVNNINAALQVE